MAWVERCADLARRANLPSATAERWRSVDRYLVEASEEMGVAYSLLVALVFVESRFRTGAVSRAGARGLTQTIDSTGRELARRLGIPYEPHNPEASARMGALYLREMLRRFPLQEAIAAYNAGPGAVAKYGGIPPFAQTRAYVPAVLRAARAVAASRARCAETECPPNSSCAPSILPQWRPRYGYSGPGSSPGRPSPVSPSTPRPGGSFSAGAGLLALAAFVAWVAAEEGRR